MKKRLMCAFLTLIMLVSLVPVAALPASAAGLSVSESAITVLKQWNGYRSTCGANGYTGYGTSCPIKATHGAHKISQVEADKVLRQKLSELDTAINSFASKAGLSLSQSQHDALVLFSFDNGTAWTTGTGSFRSAVVNKLTGTDFLAAICRWQSSTSDDNRRKVEANMYLYGVYSSVAPAYFISVKYSAGGVAEPVLKFDEHGDVVMKKNSKGELILDADGFPIPDTGYEWIKGSLNGANFLQYYDVTKNPAPHLVPTLANHTFTGWYESTLDFNSNPDDMGHPEDKDYDPTTRVTALTSAHNNKFLVAGWVPTDPGYDPSDLEIGNVGVSVYYVIPGTQILSSKVYDVPNGKAVKNDKVSNYYFDPAQKAVRVDLDYIDTKGVRWCRLITDNPLLLDEDGRPVKDVSTGEYKIDYAKKKIRWIKVAAVTTSNTELPDIDVTVTVTNTYVRSRENETIYSAQNGTYYQGQQLRIINTASNDGFLWGQVAKSATDNTPIGWVALMYTNFEEVRNQSNVNQAAVIAKATIKDSAYVNLRSEAGSDKQIIGALAKGNVVELYEIKYVNGHRWGRCSTGWLNLSFADVTMLTNDNSYVEDTNYLSYVFTGGLLAGAEVYTSPDATSLAISTNRRWSQITITQLAVSDGYTWGKYEEGWVKISDAAGNPVGVNLDTAKYIVTSNTLTVRRGPSHSEDRMDTLNKGVEFDINSGTQIVVTGDSVWAYAYKVGETDNHYNGWVNLAGAGVSRVDMPTVKPEEDNSHNTGKQATVVNTDSVNLRAYNDASYAKVGSLPRGTTVAVWEEEDGWYKIDSNRNGKYDYEGDGWASGKYLQISEAQSGGTSGNGATGGSGSASGSSAETGLGIVANTYTGVNVRTGAGTGYAANGKILSGTTVEIMEVKTVGASKWGRVTQGWICMDYVTMISFYPVAGAAGTGNGSTGGTTTNTTASETVIFTGIITVNGTKVYTEPNTKLATEDTEKVRTVNMGTPVTVHELLAVEETEVKTHEDDPSIPEGTTVSTVTTHYWARTNDGYVENPTTTIELDPLAEKVYTVTSYVSSVDNELDVYTTATSGVLTGSTLNMYDQVTVTTLRIIDNQLWCRVEYTDDEGTNQSGFVKMKYLTNGVVSNPANNTNNNTNNNNANTNNGNAAGNVNNNLTLGSTGNTANQGTNGYVNNAGGYRYTGSVIRTGSVNVRATPSQTGALTTTLKGGAALVIYETTISEGMAWGRCDAGWVYLYYVDLQPCNSAVDAKVVYNENTIIYTDANCSGVAGTYSRMSVVDIYEVVGSMCRTEQGWVHMDNLG